MVAQTLWERVIEDRVHPRRLGVVEDGLVYRSGQIHRALMPHVLEEKEIALVLDLTGKNTRDPDEVAEIEAVRELGIEYVRLPLKGDGTGDIGHYETALTLMSEAIEKGKPTLVHCAAGTARTGLLVAYYRMLIEGWTPEETLEEMRRYDFEPSGHPEATAFFDEQLPILAERLVENGLIEPRPVDGLRIAP